MDRLDGSREGAPSSDYRTSHLEKGTTYDNALGGSALDRYLASCEKRLILTLTSRLFPGGIPRYLDFACGTGRIAAILEEYARESYGIDVSETMLAEAHRKCRRTILTRIDITRERLRLEPVDLVTAFRFFGNAQDELRVSALGAIRESLRPGGYLLLNNHRNPWAVRNLLLRLSGDRSVEDLHYRKLRRLLVQAGFELVRTYGVGFWLVRARLVRDPILDSRAAGLLEPISRIRPLGPFCPDAVILARKA